MTFVEWFEITFKTEWLKYHHEYEKKHGFKKLMQKRRELKTIYKDYCKKNNIITNYNE